MQHGPRTRSLPVHAGLWSVLFFPMMACGEMLVGWPMELPPSVISTAPTANAADVPLNTEIYATFSMEMAGDSLSAESFRLLRDGEEVAGTVRYAGFTATFSPDAPLAPSAEYIADIGVEARSIEGVSLASPYGWMFTTEADPIIDLLYPRVLVTDPVDQEVEVSLLAEVSGTFSARMDPATVDAVSFTVRDAGGEIAGEVSYAGTTAFFVPEAPLDLDTLYTATLTDQIQDEGGLALQADTVWTFRTTSIVDPPLVIVTDPADLETDVPTDTAISALFSMAMDPLSLTTDTFWLMAPDASEVPGAVSYDSFSETATFTPTDPLLPDALYVATLTPDVMARTGVALESEHVWRFTTRIEEEESSLLVDLGSLETFVAVSGAGLTTSSASGPSTLNGDVGLSPTATCLGDGVPCTTLNPVVNGTLYANDSAGVAAQAKVDLTAAFIDAMGRPPGTPVSDISDLILPPGVYTSASSLNIATNQTVYLDAEGDPNGVWIFQVGSAMTVGTGAQIVLLNGARASHVFWAVGSSTTLNADVRFQGTILSAIDTSIGTDSIIVGRLLCSTGQLTLLSNYVTLPL